MARAINVVNEWRTGFGIRQQVGYGGGTTAKGGREDVVRACIVWTYDEEV